MVRSNILRIIRQTRLLPQAKRPQLNTPASKNLHPDHVVQRAYSTPDEAKKSGPRTIWQRLRYGKSGRLHEYSGAFTGTFMAVAFVHGYYLVTGSSDEVLDLEEARRLGRISRLAREAEQRDGAVDAERASDVRVSKEDEETCLD